MSLSFLAALGRLLGQYGINSFQTVFCRLAFALLVMVMVMVLLISNRNAPRLTTTQLKAYFLRLIFGLMAMWTWFYSLTLIQIGEQTAISFLAPVFTTIGASIFLGEHVRFYRWLAIAIAFVGAIIIIGPNLININLGQAFAVISAMSMGCSILIIEHLTRFDSPIVIVFISNVIMTPVALVPAFWVWQWPQPKVWAILIATGPIAVIGHLTLVKEYVLANASLLAGLDYARLPFAIAIGWLLFREPSSLWTWLGASIIFCSSLYVTRREIKDKHSSTVNGPDV